MKNKNSIFYEELYQKDWIGAATAQREVESI